MTVTITGVAGTSINAAATLPSPGELIRAENVQASSQSHCNDLATIKSGVMTFAGAKSFSSVVTALAGVQSTTFALTTPTSFRKNTGTPTAIEGSFVRDVYGRLVDATTGSVCSFDLLMPNGSTLTTINVQISGGGGHGSLPAVLPQISLYKVRYSGGATLIAGPVLDGSVNVAAYDSYHPISLLSMTEVIDDTLFRYILVFAGESGANSLSDLIVNSCDFSVTVGTIDVA